jgi:hypothetical protein
MTWPTSVVVVRCNSDWRESVAQKLLRFAAFARQLACCRIERLAVVSNFADQVRGLLRAQPLLLRKIVDLVRFASETRPRSGPSVLLLSSATVRLRYIANNKPLACISTTVISHEQLATLP